MRNLYAPSRWPPDDFLLEVLAFEQTDDGLVEHQAMHVFQDGVVVFRRASPEFVIDSSLPLTVFDTLCVYQLQHESLRGLGRALELANLLEIEPINDVTPESTRGRSVSIRYRAFGTDGQISSDTAPTGSLDRIVRVINGFAPRQVPFTFRGLGVQNEDRYVDEVPAPRRNPEDALAIHIELTRMHPDLERLWLDDFAIAVALGRYPEAHRAITGLRAAALRRVQNTGGTDGGLPGLGTDADVLELLEAILAEAEAEAPTRAGG